MISATGRPSVKKKIIQVWKQNKITEEKGANVCFKNSFCVANNLNNVRKKEKGPF